MDAVQPGNDGGGATNPILLSSLQSNPAEGIKGLLAKRLNG